MGRAFTDIQAGRSKLRHIEIMRELFRSIILLSPSDIVPCIYIATNKVRAEHNARARRFR
jgi:hypothetical protein